MSDWRPILKSQFDGEDGSFLLQLRCDNTWDRIAFDRLIAAMKSCCISSAGAEVLDRWVADGFWDTESIVRDWLSDSSSNANHSPEYFRAALELLHELSYWYFRDELPAGPGADPELFALELPD